MINPQNIINKCIGKNRALPTFKEKLVATLKEKLDIDDRTAENFADGLISKKIPFIRVGDHFKIEVR